MAIQGLDAWLTTEPDNGFIEWLDKVWSHIPESDISAKDYEEHEDYLDHLAFSLSTSGAGRTFCSTRFAAEVITRRLKKLKYMLSEFQ